MTTKKKAPARAHKVRSRGLWIAPDLERKIKGEGGRRGLTDPPYSYYLHLADLVLKPAGPNTNSAEPLVSKEPKPDIPQSLIEPPPLQTIASPPAPVIPVRPAGPSTSLVDEIPAPMPPIAPPLILPTLQLPKPPKRTETPKPVKRVAPRAAHPRPPKSAVPKNLDQNLGRVARPKSSIPKPPKG
jgi:hypothetical protein